MSELRGDMAILIDRGGLVMLPLLALSVISLTLIAERIWFWATLHRPGRVRWLRRLNEALRDGDRELADKLLDGDRTPYGQVSRQMLVHGTGDAVAMEAVEAQRPRFDRWMVSLSTIITAAPLLGILGTVIGIIQSFNLLGEQETLADPSAVSAGIAEALLTTALGLVVALVTLFPYMVFRAQVERAMGRVESVIAAAQQGAEAAPERRLSDSALALAASGRARRAVPVEDSPAPSQTG